jgi:hypothetical protein
MLLRKRLLFMTGVAEGCRVHMVPVLPLLPLVSLAEMVASRELH